MPIPDEVPIQYQRLAPEAQGADPCLGTLRTRLVRGERQPNPALQGPAQLPQAGQASSARDSPWGLGTPRRRMKSSQIHAAEPICAAESICSAEPICAAELICAPESESASLHTHFNGGRVGLSHQHVDGSDKLA
jgi:hypothetical protein